MIQVTFKSVYKIKQGRRWIDKTSTWQETVKTEADARLRALALNWQIIEIKPIEVKP